MLSAQPTSILLSILTIAALLFSGIELVRLRILPWWAKLVGVLLAVYGITAFVLAVKSGTPYLQLFHGASEWTVLPFWLQGATVGTLLVIPLTILLELINTLKHHTQKFFRWLIHAALLGACFAIGIFAIRTGPQSEALAATGAGSTTPEPEAPVLKPAELSKDGGPAGPELTTGDYNFKQSSSPPSASNNATSLTIREFRMVSSLGDQQPAPRHAFLIVSTDWKNTGAMPYMVPGVVDHLFLLIDGHRPATVSDATRAAAHPLPTDNLTIPNKGDSLSGDYVFEVPDHGVTGIQLFFIDTNQGDMRLPLFGNLSSSQRAMAGPLNNGLVEAAVLEEKEVDSVGDAQAPPGQKYAELSVRMRGLSQGNLVRFDPVMYSVLKDSDGYQYQVAQLDGLDDEFTSATQLLPNIPSQGMLAFLVPASHSALTLAINLPSYKSMEFALPNTGGSGHIGKPLLSIDDGDTLTLDVLAVKRMSSIGGNTPESGQAYLVLDVLFSSKVGDGIEFQTSEQLILLDGDRQIKADPDALNALAHGLKENTVIPADSQARFEVAYKIPITDNHFGIRYRGFKNESKESLPDVSAQ
jgi:hypothetical protein